MRHRGGVEVEELLRRSGGLATRAELEAPLGRTALDRAVEVGRLVRVGRGRFALPGVAADRRRAHALNGVLSHESAALHHGWPVLLAPEQPHVTLPVRRRVSQERSRDVTLHRVDLHPDDVRDGLTSPDRTMLDCLRACSFPAALAFADSALRQGRTPGWLARVAGEARGHGARQARRVAAAATDLAANPFESGLRAVALDVRGLTVRPQAPLYSGGRFIGRPDLVDLELGIVLESDSFKWHGGRSALVRDARRYNDFTAALAGAPVHLGRRGAGAGAGSNRAGAGNEKAVPIA
ncbi:hypothetical protein E2C04_14515 [Nocardioides daphniae]|uniref:AbiEi antitoxin N-terminal domain-containing protein n=1 Tax=Nocardioides daphniae TaxID=402297 RepID=A0A4P7UD00_9ACTN|nr:hypothetical protein E2C04_14515 [Nocardioides daphniae]